MLDLDLSILSWDIIGRFVAKGFVFSIQLTLIAMSGGILFGTLLALMRLSGKKWLDAPAAPACPGRSRGRGQERAADRADRRRQDFGGFPALPGRTHGAPP